MRLTIIVFAAALSACSSVAPETAPVPTPAAVRHRPGRITRAELDTQRGRHLADAIRAIDNGLLMNRGEGLQVWIDGAAFTVARLETLPANDVLEVQRLSAADARQMFGDRATGAGLVVRTRMR